MASTETSTSPGGLAVQLKQRSNSLFFGISKGQAITLVFALLAANALLSKITNGVVQDGWIYAILNTFEVSAIVWAGLFLGFSFASKIEGNRISKLDRVVLVGAMIACFLPLGPLTWPIMSSVALYFILTANGATTAQHQAGWVFLAVTVPMFWSKQLFSVFSDFFLSIDASLVASITGTERTSNLVAMPGGNGFMQIAAPCSSMANVSLAVLCWVLFTQMSKNRWRPKNIMWCAFACLAVIAINVTRITLIGYFPQYFELLHGPIGATVVSWLSLAVVVVVCNYGVGNARRNAI